MNWLNEAISSEKDDLKRGCILFWCLDRYPGCQTKSFP